MRKPPTIDGVAGTARTPVDHIVDHLMAALFWARESRDGVIESAISVALLHIAGTREPYDDWRQEASPVRQSLGRTSVDKN